MEQWEVTKDVSTIEKSEGPFSTGQLYISTHRVIVHDKVKYQHNRKLIRQCTFSMGIHLSSIVGIII